MRQPNGNCKVVPFGIEPHGGTQKGKGRTFRKLCGKLIRMEKKKSGRMGRHRFDYRVLQNQEPDTVRTLNVKGGRLKKSLSAPEKLGKRKRTMKGQSSYREMFVVIDTTIRHRNRWDQNKTHKKKKPKTSERKGGAPMRGENDKGRMSPDKS